MDNHDDAARSMADLLGLFGYAAAVVATAEAALAADPPDAMLIELRLPGTDGWELVRRLRARPLVRHPLYVAVTTCGREQDIRRSEEAGLDHHFVKPVEPAHLLGLLDHFRHPSASELRGQPDTPDGPLCYV